MKKTKLIIALCLSAYMGFAQTFTNPFTGGTTRFAGNGISYGTTVEGAVATATPLYSPWGIVVNKLGETYIADNANHVILKVDIFGDIHIIAGTMGVKGYFGDGMPALGTGANSVYFNQPTYLALDNVGNLYIADCGNAIVRKITAHNGTINPVPNSYVYTISTVAGVDPTIPGGGLFNNGVQKCNSGSTACGDLGPANNAMLNQPTGLAIDNNNNLFIVDGIGTTIREVLASSSTFCFGTTTYAAGTINTIAGGYGNIMTGCSVCTNITATGNSFPGVPALSTNFSSLVGIAFDVNCKNLYIADQNINQVDRLDMTDHTYKGYIYGFAGQYLTGGTAADGLTQAHVTFPGANGVTCIAVDGNNNVYVGSTDPSANISGVVMINNGNPLSGKVETANCFGVAVDACNNLYYTDESYYSVYKALNGAAASFAPTISIPSPICSGSNINATGSSGGTTPDSYTWELQSCTPAGVYDGGPIIGPFTNNSASYSFPTTGLPCGHNYLVSLTVTKQCPVAVSTTISQITYINCNPTPVITGNLNICSGSSTTLCENNYPANNPYTVTWDIITSHGGYTYVGSLPCIIESPTANTTYNVTVANTSTGCSGSASALVTVSTNNTSFNLTEGSLPANATLSAQINTTPFTSSAGFGYFWGVEELSTSGSVYWATSASAHPCYWQNYPNGVTEFNGIANTPSDYPTGTFSSTFLPLCSAATGFVTGYTCNTPSAGKFAYAKTYVVTLTSWSSACTTGVSTAYTVTMPSAYREAEPAIITKGGVYQSTATTTGIDKISASTQVSIYPNPNNGNFTIETFVTTPQLVEVYDLTGRLVLSQNISGTATINGISLTDGVYNIKVSGNDNVVNKRIVISK